MQRLVLAVLMVAAIIALMVAFILIVRQVARGALALSGNASEPTIRNEGAMQKIAFALLMGLVAYVALLGPT